MRKLWNLMMILVIGILVAQGEAQTRAAASPVLLHGNLSIIWGDGAPGTGSSQVHYFLTLADGQVVPLQIGMDAWPEGGLLALNRRAVVVQGIWTLLDGKPALQVVLIRLDGLDKPDDVTGPQPWVSVMCKFADYPDEPKDLNFFEGMYSETFPGLDHYWREQSYDLVNLEGSGAYGWYTLPHTREYYLPGGNLDWYTAAEDCTAVADGDIYYPDYVGINLMFNAVLDCCAWGGSMYLCRDDVCQYWRMTWEPPWGYENIAVIAHETGHGFGLPHSSGDYGQTYDNYWDVMSYLWSNDQRGGYDPVYGTLGQHTISYHKDMLGWIDDPQVFQADLGTYRTITLERLALPQTGNYLIARIPINGSPYNFYTLEARDDTSSAGYDDWLPGTAVIIHEVLEGRENPAHVLDIDNNGNTGDEGAMWRVGETFMDMANHIFVTVESATATGFVVTIENTFTRLSQVDLSGPEVGDIGQPITFTAQVMPLNVTQPLTYTWQATGQEPVTHTGGTSDSLSFTWLAPGTQVITVTASNAGSIVRDVINVEIIQPLQAVVLEGPASGLAGTPSTLTATVSPLDASLPVVYVWEVAGSTPITHSGGVSEPFSLVWLEPGTATITVTASNAGGEGWAVHSWPVYQSLTGIQLDGPEEGVVGEVYPFTVTVQPEDVTQPLTYTWQVDGHVPLTHTGGLSDTVSFSWSDPGVYTLALTVENIVGAGSYQMPIYIYAPPEVNLIGPDIGFVGQSSEFLATVQPTASLPLTYTWLVDGQVFMEHVGGHTDTITLAWETYGSHTVMVMVINPGGSSVQVWDVVVYTRTFLPLAMLR